MKKKLQKKISELALELTKLGNDYNVSNVKHSVRLLYEKLAVLEFLEGQLEDESQSFDSKSFREKNWFTEPEPVPQPEHEEALVEPLMEKIKDLVAQMPHEGSQVDDLLDQVLPEQKYIKNDLEAFASNYKDMPVFERKEQAAAPSSNPAIKSNEKDETSKPKSINETLSTGLNIGLNDRLAFIKHLFNGNADDYARVLSQINTMQSYEQADTFIKGKIKPDYNYWLSKEEYSERFMAIVEKRFN